jgi:hypothetical protein
MDDPPEPRLFAKSSVEVCRPDRRDFYADLKLDILLGDRTEPKMKPLWAQ